MKQFEYTTTLNGGIVSVYLNVTEENDECGTHCFTEFDSIWFDGTNITSILSKEQIAELEIEAEAGFFEAGWESANGY